MSFKPFRAYTIRQKLMAMSLMASAGALLLSSVVFMTYDFFAYRNTLVNRLLSLEEIISLNTASAVVFNDDVAATRILASLKGRGSIITAAIYTPSGKVFASWHRNPRAPRDLPPVPTPGKDVYLVSPNSMRVFHPMVLDNSIIGTVYIHADLEELMTRFRRYALIGAGVVTLSFIVAALIAFNVGRKISQPILNLTEMAKTVSEKKDYSVRASPGDPDELGLLVGTFNQMVMQIQGDKEALRKLNEGLEQKVAERTNELTVANKELEAFCYSVSHDLRAPLRAIDGFSSELLENEATHLGDQGQADLKRIRAATQRMGQLIDDLLKLSRITRNEVTREDVNLSAMVVDVLQALKTSSPDRSVEGVVSPELKAMGDPRLLRVALENLVGNAWKFTQKTLHARIEFGSMDRDGKKVFFIRDNGAGFNMAYAGKLFGAFQRLHDANDYPGTGIGLATVQRIVHRHGGRIWAEAEVGHGATFFFTIT